MKSSFIVICSSLVVGLSAASTGKSLDGVRDLVRRRMPRHSSSFSFEFMDGPGDSFVVSDSRHQRSGINIECTTISACSRGLYEYLREHGGVDFWWTSSGLDHLPSHLPSVGHTPMKGSSIVKYRYHFNTVTFSYTAVWFPFEDTGSNNWSYLLDWLALHGVNLPLAWTGNEYLLLEMYRTAGLNDSEILSFFSSPAFLSWFRFGNLQNSWDGEIPLQWIQDQFAMQKKIVTRMVELGMTPVFPAFTGFVPGALRRLYPNASILPELAWDGFTSNFTDVAFLNPVDPLFTTLQSSFLAKQQEAFGADTSHFYALDQYNENTPVEDSPEYLRNVSSATIASLRARDPKAVMVLQAWLFFSSATFWTQERITAYLGGMPNDAAFILDLYSEAQPVWMKTDSYGGKDWVWCQLHGFGGNIGMEGNLVNLTTKPLEALHAPGSSMKGIGLTMEGHDLSNEIGYRLLLDQAWKPAPINLSSYISSYVSQRYPVQGHLPSAALQAWKILGTTVYNNSNPNAQATVKSVFVLQPALTGLTNQGGHHPTIIFYNTSQTIVPALKLLVQASKQTEEIRGISEFAFDVVDLARQLLANFFIDHYENLVATYNSPNSTAEDVALAGEPLLDILADLDAVLMTNRYFLLSDWIRSARALAGNNRTYADYLEADSRNQITLWGAKGENKDYAAKDWGGLVRSYYQPRWDYFVGYLQNSKKSSTPYNATAVNQAMLDFGERWGTEIWGTHPGETWETRGDTWEVVDKVLKKWVH